MGGVYVHIQDGVQYGGQDGGQHGGQSRRSHSIKGEELCKQDDFQHGGWEELTYIFKMAANTVENNHGGWEEPI